MEGYPETLQQHIDFVEQLTAKIENNEYYIDELRGYLPPLNRMIQQIFALYDQSMGRIELNIDFVVQVLQDIVCGIEHEDEVYLLDVLRYGLLEIYCYIETELQGEYNYE